MSAPQNPAAFPVSDGVDVQFGMTLRDWFAGQALAGLAQRGMPSSFGTDLEKWQAALARSCFGLADAMLAAREQKA